MNTRRFFLLAACGLLVFAVIMPGLFGSAAEAVNPAPPLVDSSQPRPSELDVRGVHGVPRGTALRAPAATQLRALASLEAVSGASLQVRYNGLTATPSHLFSYTGYLTPPSSAPPEMIARDFLARWRGIFRFSDSDLSNLRLKTRATIPDTGTTIIVLEQQVNNLPVYKGEVLVNINPAGRVINVGSENFPQLSVSNAFTLSAAQAIINAANALNVSGFTPQSLGTTQVLRSFGDLPPYHIEGQKFSGGGTFTDDIIVTRVAFPVGDTARAAYKFVLTTPQYEGIMWENIVDAQNGEILRRASLTAFQSKSKTRASGARSRSSAMKSDAGKEANFGPPGGGTGVGRFATFRPDIQNSVESHNAAGTATGKVFDGAPTALSGRLGTGRTLTPGVPPTYAAETETVRNNGRGFKQSLVFARIQTPLFYNLPLGQALRGLPDAANPNASSPFGWFYLPTNTGGAEITVSDINRATTQAFGYNMATEAAGRNVEANSPNCAPPAPCADKSQPFSASLTPLMPSVTLPDSRVLSSVFESRYTEGNNVLAADDHENDNETTHGVKGYDADRQFDAGHFDFINSYEYNTANAGGTPFFPPSTFPDVYPGAVTLFYYNNIMHDYLYSIGFTEPLFNFQQDNFGKGGAGRDAVSAQVQDGSGTNNANMGTGADGGAPRMQMFLFTEPTFRRSDGDFDFDIVGHEFFHGVSNRSAGKGDSGCLGVTLVGESGGQGEGWSDYIADSMGDDDAIGEFATGEHDIAIRRLPLTNFRYSYGSINQRTLNRRDQQPPDTDTGTGTPFAVHRTGEVWSATIWDMRELLIVKQQTSPGVFPGVFFDGTRRLGAGAFFYIGNRLVNSVDLQHPINYRESFRTTAVQAVPGGPPPAPTIKASEHIVRPGLVAAENAANPARNGSLATAVANGARLADTLVLRGLQLSPCNPSFVDSRDSILLADRELTGGENQAIIWRAFASHGVGLGATSSASDPTDDPGSQSAPVIVENFTVPQGVTVCEMSGPLAAPIFSLANTTPNTVTVTINLTPGANKFIISRAESAGGPFVTIAEVPASTTGPTNYNDPGRELNHTYFYQVRASRDAQSNCVSTSNPAQSITIVNGVVLPTPPVFFGVKEVLDPKACNLLVVNWDAALSTNPSAQIVYDVYRTDKIDPVGNPGISEPTFTPSPANRITPAGGVTTTTYTDTNLTLDKPYYYIVQARDTNNGQIDTNNTGNRLAKFNAPTSPSSTNTPVFPTETFETAAADSRFTPPLTESGNNPDETNQATFQRVTGVPVGSGLVSSTMYAANFTPGGEADPTFNTGGPSDFSTRIGTGTPLQLTPTSILEFDHFFSTEASFDGGVVEISIGDASFGGNNPLPNNTTVFDLGYYMIEGGYNGRLDGTLAAGVFLSPLQGRRAFTGSKGPHHVRIALQPFAGGINNPTNAPVFIRFRMTSDVGTSAGENAGWYIDNLVINNLDPAACPTVAAVALGDVIISEFRLRGTDGPNDEFIEFYNKTEAPIIVTPSDNSGGFTLAAPNSSGVLTPLATIPSGTVIPARGHFLIANNSSTGGVGGYSLANYGGTNRAAPDATYQMDIPDNSGVALFRTTNTGSLTAANRLDAAGFSSAPPEYREGTGLAPIGSTNAEYSHVRNLTTGFPKDTGENSADFLLVHMAGAPLNGVASILGAPGPENTASPIQRNAVIKASLIDPGCAGFGTMMSACARVRTADGANPQNAAFGTLLIRRRFRNTTNESVRQLRFRAVNISTLGNLQSGEADVRVLSSSDVTVTDSSGNPNVFIEGLTLEENPPAQPNGGGLNSTVRLNTITLGRPLAPGNSVNVQFRLGVMTNGNFRFLVNVEALP